LLAVLGGVVAVVVVLPALEAAVVLLVAVEELVGVVAEAALAWLAALTKA
jgi:hypothetical protein